MIAPGRGPVENDLGHLPGTKRQHDGGAGCPWRRHPSCRARRCMGARRLARRRVRDRWVSPAEVPRVPNPRRASASSDAAHAAGQRRWAATLQVDGPSRRRRAEIRLDGSSQWRARYEPARRGCIQPGRETRSRNHSRYGGVSAVRSMPDQQPGGRFVLYGVRREARARLFVVRR